MDEHSVFVPCTARAGRMNCIRTEENVFREYEKVYAGRIDRHHFKGKSKSAIDPTDIYDFLNLEKNCLECRENIFPIKISPELRKSRYKWLRPPETIYTLKHIEGLYFVPNPFTDEQQRYMTKRCIKEYTLGNPTNISNLELIETGKETRWTVWNRSLMKNLRWASLGYHFQWTPRVYLENHRDEFPADLREFVKEAASLIGHGDMHPEAAIINFYHHDKYMMGGHLDDAEEDMTKPIVSTSFGNTAIFLIGGRTRDVRPTAMYIRSGDVVMMAGESRYCFHGIPKVLSNTSPSLFELHGRSLDEEEWDEDLSDYMKNARVNINARQVRYRTD